jgi:hypothetical protein
MKKLVLGCLLLLGSFGVYAEEEIVITGVPLPQQDFSSLSSGVVTPPTFVTMYSTSYTPATYAAQQAAQAAGKKAAKQGCIDKAKEMNNNEYEDSRSRLNDQTADCKVAFAHEPEAMSTCNDQAYDHYGGSIEASDQTLVLRKAYCEKLYGN